MNAIGYLTAWPSGQPSPCVHFEYRTAPRHFKCSHRARAGTHGDIAVYTSDDTDLMVDINGYFAPTKKDLISACSDPINFIWMSPAILLLSLRSHFRSQNRSTFETLLRFISNPAAPVITPDNLESVHQCAALRSESLP